MRWPLNANNRPLGCATGPDELGDWFARARPPWMVPFQPVDRRRLVIVYNLDVAWSYFEAVYYAQAHGIPLANLVGFNMGAAGGAGIMDFADTAAIHSQFLAPLRALYASVGALGVLFAPGTPIRFSKAGVGAAPLMSLAAFAKGLPNPASDIVLTDYGSGRWGWGLVSGWTASAWLAVKMALAPSRASGPPESPNAYGALALGQAPGSHYGAHAPRTWGTEFFGTVDHVQLMHGRIGFADRGGTPVPETQALARALVDNALALSRRTATECRRLPIFVDVNSILGDHKVANTYAALCGLLASWGLPLRVLVREEPDAGYSALIPAGARVSYTAADVLAGTVAPDPHYLRLGTADNGEIAQTAARAAWPPLPGAVSLVGPSDSGQYSMADIVGPEGVYRGGVGGTCAQTHPTNVDVYELISTGLCLLQGMTLLEAFYFSDGDAPGCAACGDPLFAPYGGAP